MEKTIKYRNREFLKNDWMIEQPIIDAISSSLIGDDEVNIASFNLTIGKDTLKYSNLISTRLHAETTLAILAKIEQHARELRQQIVKLKFEDDGPNKGT